MRRSVGWALILLVPMALYTAGLAYGRPRPEYSPSTVQNAWLNGTTVYHPDEFAYVGIPYRMLLTDQWNPHYFHNPSLNLYTNVGLFWLSGAENLPHNVRYGDREIAPFQLYVMARYMSALYTLLAVALTAATGRLIGGRRMGWIAAAVLAVSPLMVQHAHYATPNAETIMLASASLLLAVMIVLDRAPARWPLPVVYGAAGLLVGLTMAARYNAVVVGLVTGLALLTAWGRHRHTLPVVVGFVAMPLGFALGTPGIVFATQEVIDQIRDILDTYRLYGGGSGFTTEDGPLSGFFYHWRYTVLFGIGPVALLAAGIGWGALQRRARRLARWQEIWIALALLLYMLVYTGLALRGKRLQANLLLPLLAPLALLAAQGVIAVWERLGGGRKVLTGLLVITLIWPLTVSILFAHRIATPDTRQRAQEWIYAHIPRGTSIYLLEPYNVPLDPLDYTLTQTFGGEAGPEQVQASTAQVIVYSDTFPMLVLRDASLSSDWEIAREEGIRQVLANEWIELKRFERWPWPGENVPPDDVSYWHQMEIVIYCHPDRCPLDPATLR